MELNPETIKFILTVGVLGIAFIGAGKLVFDKLFPANKKTYKYKPFNRDHAGTASTPRAPRPQHHNR